MEKLIIENFRCFEGRIEIPIAPITVLIGENSTGKSSVLAAYKKAQELGRTVKITNFNEEPFLLGSYKDIAYNRGGIAESFSIGHIHDIDIGENKIERLHVEMKFNEKYHQPFPCEAIIKYNDILFNFEISEEDNEYYNVKVESDLFGTIAFNPISTNTLDFLYFWHFWFTPPERKSDPINNESKEVLNKLKNCVNEFSSQNRYKPFSLAPIRTKPRRSYDPTTIKYEITGEHTPQLLAKYRLIQKAKWDILIQEIKNFGIKSGLFSDITIRGRRGDTFKIFIKIKNKYYNLIDVGYGISQILPMLVESLLERDSSMFLFQQPEVHLHPKAQAQLGSFFARISKVRKHKFVIETHSDYLVDRLRMEIMDGTISSDDLAVLYFHRKGRNIKIERINIDAKGRIINPPEGYREFFLDEMKRKLGG